MPSKRPVEPGAERFGAGHGQQLDFVTGDTSTKSTRRQTAVQHPFGSAGVITFE